jgi:hypothetical protein
MTYRYIHRQCELCDMSNCFFCKYVVVLVSAGNWYSIIRKKRNCDKEITFVMIVKCLLGLVAVNKKKKKNFALI